MAVSGFKLLRCCHIHFETRSLLLSLHIRFKNQQAKMSSIPDEKKVAYSFLGKTGIKVSNLCLGTLTFGQSAAGFPGQTNEEESHKILDRFLEWGGNFIDTADMYGPMHSERILGTWLEKQPRDSVVIATKVRASVGKDVNAVGLSRRHITDAIDNSLTRLRTHYVDLYQTHAWDDGVDIRETLLTLNDLVQSGKIRYYGVSNVSGWQMQKIVETTEKLGLNPCASLQQQYSLMSRESEVEAFQVAKANGVTVLPWSPLKRGLLSGKVRRGQPIPEGSRVSFHNVTKFAPGIWTGIDEQAYNVIDLADEIGKSKSPPRSVAQVALRWLIQKDVVSSVIIGAKSVQQLDDNMGASSGWALTKEEMEKLDEASRKDPGYPYNTLGFWNEHRYNPDTSNYYVQSVY